MAHFRIGPRPESTESTGELTLTYAYAVTHVGFPKIRGTLLGVPKIRIIVFWGLY